MWIFLLLCDMIKRNMGECKVGKDNIAIHDKDLKAAQMICASISDTNKRNKAIADVIGAKIAAEYFDNSSYQIDNTTSLHNIPSIVESYDIADIYINGVYVDVRVYFNNDELCIPKIHYDLNITPTLYMFIKLSPDLTQAEVKGFLRPETTDKNNTDGHVYFAKEQTLESYYDIESKLEAFPDIAKIDDKKIFDFATDGLSEPEVVDLIKTLEVSKSLRLKLKKVLNAQAKFNLVSAAPDSNTAENTEQKTTKPEASFDELYVDDGSESNVVDDDVDLADFATEVNIDGVDFNEDFSTDADYDQSDVQNIAKFRTKQTKELSEDDDSIGTLFTGEQEGVPVSKRKIGNPIANFLVFILMIVLIGGTGYYLYETYFDNKDADDLSESFDAVSEEVVEDNTEKEVKKKPEPMPVETVENVSNNSKKEEASPISVPAIERNIDASILVSNLKIDWEVPAGYVSNTAAKRYLVKLGKIIQLNLKTELLLLRKPPLSNKITVELTFNTSSGKFDVVGIQQSSGEKSVDNVILQTVESALKMNIIKNTDSFAKIQGNPILIIRL